MSIYSNLIHLYSFYTNPSETLHRNNQKHFETRCDEAAALFDLYSYGDPRGQSTEPLGLLKLSVCAYLLVGLNFVLRKGAARNSGWGQGVRHCAVLVEGRQKFKFRLR